MRQPGRLHITWQDDQTLKIETDAGHSDTYACVRPPRPEERRLAGRLGGELGSRRNADGRGGFGPTPMPEAEPSKVVTTGMKAGYLRRTACPTVPTPS